MELYLQNVQYQVVKANVVCPKCNKATKVGYTVEKDEKVRVCKNAEQN